ncbi:UNVERIFIED_CONTAM: hypothetical protein HDU68_009414 [Siphonaria sp. JEL0065]|nr:hypothetical protein HDU68_009414 [Siphonaria sp. JEL0065]
MTPPIKSPTDHPSVFHCMWNTNSRDPAMRATTQRCPNTFDTANELFIHLSEDHIGRRALGSLQLNCEWIGCVHPTRIFAKRDNAVSHIRHVHFRANICQDCNSHYKWPQDLKKHCLRTGHAYVEPDGKGKPGPSPVYVIEADGLGPTLVRLGPSLTGGRQKAFQRFEGSEGKLRTSSTTLKPASKVGFLTKCEPNEETSPSASASPTLDSFSSIVSASPKEPVGLPVLPSISSMLAGFSSQRIQETPKHEYQESPAHSRRFNNYHIGAAKPALEPVVNPQFYNQTGLPNQPYPPMPQYSHESYHVRSQPPSQRVEQQFQQAQNDYKFPHRSSPYQVPGPRAINPGFRVVPPPPPPSQYNQHSAAWHNHYPYHNPQFHHSYDHQPPQQYIPVTYNTLAYHGYHADHY